MNLTRAYSLVAEVAAPSESEGLNKARSILVLWFLRHVHGVDDLEAYEFVCDGDNDHGVDALYLEPEDVEDEVETLLLFQSRYTQSAKNIGVGEIRKLIGSAETFQNADRLEELLTEGIEPELDELIRRFEVVKKLREGRLRLRSVFVTAGKLTSPARKLIQATNENRRYQFLKAYDVMDLAPIIEAFRSPSTVSATISVPCPEDQRFVCDIPDGRVAVCRVSVREIVCWPGIEDRSLFDLNVRRELGKNQVRKALDRAIRKAADHPNFVAYHNGLTVVCRKIEDTDSQSLTITDLSVVNGAQSTIAFKDNETSISNDLSVVVKFVEVPSARQLAREVAIRSNTQNPVNARNLRARDGIQLRLVREFEEGHPEITYEVRPDASVVPTGHVIQNDEAAQLISAVYNQTPWIAIRRLSLFDAARYPTVFTPEISAAHVVLVDLMADQVQRSKDLFPAEYLRSWRLTKLVGVYLMGQMLRTSEDLERLLSEPDAALTSRVETQSTLQRLSKFAAATLKTRWDEKRRTGKLDDFKVDFKREDALKDLAGIARNTYLTITTVEAE